MSAALELVRELLDEWARGEFGDTGRFDEQVEVVTDAPDGMVYHGVDGLRRAWGNWAEAWKDVTVVAERIVEEGEGRVVANVRYRAEGRESGIVTDRPAEVSFSVRDGRITRMEAVWEAGGV